jgi:hypothetical protein
MIRLSADRRAALLELFGLLLWFLLFSRLHAAVAKDVAVATANALDLQAIERSLHIGIELRVNRWLAGHTLLSHLGVYLYRLYYAAILGVLVWVYLRRADVYDQVRRTLVAMMVLVLPVYWAVPMSPPRFALPGVVDIVAAYDIFGDASTDTGSAQNYTAMPSMHVGFALWCAYAVWSALRVAHPRRALLAWIFPLLMIADVLGTGNHYVLDIAGSIALFAAAVAAAWLCGRLIERLRRPGSSSDRAAPAASVT